MSLQSQTHISVGLSASKASGDLADSLMHGQHLSPNSFALKGSSPWKARQIRGLHLHALSVSFHLISDIFRSCFQRKISNNT